MKAALVIAIAGILIIGILFIAREPEPAEQAGTGPAGTAPGVVKFLMEQQWLIRMKLAVAEDAEMSPQIQSVGRVSAMPSKRAVVAPPVSGILQGPMPHIGRSVAQGQVLTSILQTPSAAEAAQLRIETTRIDAERRRLSQAEVEARARTDKADRDLERARRLFEKKAYSQKQLEMDELDVTSAKARLAAIREQMAALQTPAPAAVYEVRAPISGTVVGLNKASGEQVNPGEMILEIVALDTLWVETPVFEKNLGQLARNMEARFTTATFPGMEFTGRLVNIGAVIDEETRAATVVFEVDNRSGQLRIGMQANVRLDAGPKRKVVLVPREAVLDNEGQKTVYVMRSGEEFERRNVLVGDEHGARVAVLEGVRPGERVVTQGAYQLKLQELRPANAGAHTHEL